MAPYPGNQNEEEDRELSSPEIVMGAFDDSYCLEWSNDAVHSLRPLPPHQLNRIVPVKLRIPMEEVFHQISDHEYDLSLSCDKMSNLQSALTKVFVTLLGDFLALIHDGLISDPCEHANQRFWQYATVLDSEKVGVVSRFWTPTSSQPLLRPLSQLSPEEWER